MSETAVELEKVIAKIEGMHLGYEDHGIFSLNVAFTFGSSAQGTGHFCVCSRESDNDDDKYGIRLVKAVIDACGVDEWSRIKGRTVYALKEPGWSGYIRGIEPLPTEKGERVIFAELWPEEDE